MNKRNVLLIAYYWPPAGGGGVHRWLKMSKYLVSNEIKLTVFTPDICDSTVLDESLTKEVNKYIKVVRVPIWEPYDLYKKFTGKKKGDKVYSGFIQEGGKSSFTQKLSVFIRGNFFIPDARKYWIKPSVKFLSKYLKENDIDVVISTGPPHSMHLIANGVKEKHPQIKWIADFRDPWTKIDFYEQLQLSKWADNKHKKLEKKVLKNADKIVTVSTSWKKDFENISQRNDVELIHNGFDKEDFLNNNNLIDSQFTIAHIGSMNPDRNPKMLWKVLNDLCSKDNIFKQDLDIKLIGQVDYSILYDIKKYNLDGNTKKIDFIPHNEVVKEMMKSQVLLLPINKTSNSKGILPGKLYEYMGAKRPILCVGPKEADSYKIIQETNAGYCVDYDDYEATKKAVNEMYHAFKENNLTVNSKNIDQYSREALAKKYADLIFRVVQE